MLTSITLENWRSHEKTALEFRKGTNLLIGIMGSGKSSVLDGMCFALFGTFPALEHRALTLGEVIRHEKEFARVRLGFDWKGENYEILREIKKEPKKQKTSSDAELRKQGKLMEKSQTQVTKYVEQLLQIDYDLFSRAIYSEQNNIDHFLTLDPAKRKEEIDELLGLVKFENARANSVTIINRARGARKALEEKFSKHKLDEIRKKEGGAAERHAGLEKSKKSLSEAEEKTKSLYQQCNSGFAELKSRKEKADVLKQSITKTKGALEQLREEIVGKAASEELLAEARKRRDEMEKFLEQEKKTLLELQSAQNAASKQTGALESMLENAKIAQEELKNVEIEIAQLLAGKKPDEIAAEKNALAQENIEMAAMHRSLFEEIAKTEEGMRKLSPELSKCPVCRSPLTKDGITHVLLECEDEMERKRKELEAVSAMREGKSKLYAEMEKKFRRMENLAQKMHLLGKSTAQCADYSKKLSDAQAQLAKISGSVRKTAEEVEKAAEACQRAIVEHKKMEELLLKGKKLGQLESALKKAESELGALKFGEPEFESARRELEEKRLELERISSESRSVGVQLKDSEEFLALAASERAELEAMEKEIIDLLKLEEELSIYKNTLMETQATLRKEVIDAINTAMNGIWQIVYPYGDYKGIRLTADEKGYAFEVYDGTWRAAELISGGERACLALTFRIALATVLTPNTSMLVLDEPTHNLDKEAVGVLAHVLQNNLPELIEQSFVITHEEGLMGSEFASTYKMSRNKDSNAPTIVEEI